MNRPEDELFNRFRATGDPAALAAVFDRVAPDLLAVALHLSGRRADAEDLVQDTFLVAIERAASWDPGRGLFPWLVGILTHRRHRQRRAEARHPDPERLREPTPEDPANESEARELQAAISAAVAALGDTYRPVLHLYLRHGLDAKEIAEALGRPHGTVRTQVVRALQRLRETLPAGLSAVFAVDGSPYGAAGHDTTRGLVAVRDVVLEAARTHAAAVAAATAVTTPAAVGIGLAMTKQLWLAAGLLLVASALWYAARTQGGGAAPTALTDTAASAPRTEVAAGTTTPTSGIEVGEARRERSSATVATTPRSRSSTVTVRVVGVVSSESGVAAADGPAIPLEGVTLELWPGRGEEPPLIGRRRVQTTDGMGTARFEDLGVGAFTLDVVATPGDPLAGAQQPRFLELAEGAHEQVDVTLPIHVVVQGKVVDEVGAPVADAEVWAGDEIIARGALPQHVMRRVARTARDGTFRAPLARHEERIGARKEGYADSPALATAVLGSADVEWTLKLARERAHVRGTVRDARNEPMAGLSVALQRRGRELKRRDDGLFEEGHLPLLLRSDARGEFAMDLAPGQYDCRAVGPSGRAKASFQVAVAETAFVELRFPDEVAVRGFVRTSDDLPVPSLPVWIEEVGADGRRSNAVTRTLADGSFLFLGVARRPFTIEAGRIGGRLRARSEQPSPTGSVVECVLRFDDPPPIVGRVLQANGAGAPELAVKVFTTADEYVTGATTDGEGQFELREVVAGTYRVLVARSLTTDGRVLKSFEVALSSDSPLELQLPVVRGALRGRAVDERGRPSAGISVTLSASQEETRRAVTGTDGRFMLDGVPPVSFNLRARGEKRAFVARTVEVGEDGVTDIGDLVVPAEATLEVRVFRPDGIPWTDAPPVPWLQRDGRFIAGRDAIEYALEGGKVFVHGLSSGTYEMQAPLGDTLTFTPQTVELQSGVVTQVDLHMKRGRALTLELEAPPAGSAPNGIELVVRDGQGTEALRRVVPPPFLSSKWVVEHTFPAGTYTAEATGPDGTRWRHEFEVDLEGEQPERIVVPKR